ncbi:GNAT family N-acetyltransferase [Virgibacillus necropolis]|uniref:GNAT family N-acetyltransferase n=1 Tax=Virgibacillus necropolis TaxID=163877 RepID=A0A221M7B6_9BACI|nr:GNAT family N-acetyltransferase [Virgibacillus necropolis]ASN03530.1 GNAT family N-acetyltransferase [Virgibacillus necropolis]
MISNLDLHDETEMKSILKIQLLAYQVEAKLIEFDGIPQLKDTAESIRACTETFLGYRWEGSLVGFLSYEVSGNEIDICRLVVHPSYFRKGIASSLLEFVLNENTELNRFTVSTGSKNIPAITLYKRFGFESYQEVPVAPGIYINLLERKNEERP